MLLIHVQPNEGMSLGIGAKVPGLGMTIRTVHMDFLYGGAFREGLPEAYERLILDAMHGDATLFTRADEIEEQWALVDAIVAAWQRDRPAFPNYAAGTWGPAARRRAAAPRRPLLAAALSVRRRDVERQLGRAAPAGGRRDGTAGPAHERDDARRLGAAGVGERRERTLEGMEDRHPSRTILLLPEPGGEDGLDVRSRCGASRRRRPRGAREVIWLRLRGERAAAPASLVLPLAISDLPVFLRWRGEPPFGGAQLEQLVGVADRLVVDSSEWEELARYASSAQVFDRRRCRTSSGARASTGA